MSNRSAELEELVVALRASASHFIFLHLLSSVVTFHSKSRRPRGARQELSGSGARILWRRDTRVPLGFIPAASLARDWADERNQEAAGLFRSTSGE
ncbi:hypothetical protein EYF80_025168 [Liparis tanakae]|uniref:Uncharacterized protein n=1 Tax=Liparis tanakae TaxID=230148 RepID=A0A4Z2HFN6_9TELE|nr:hypothetical protein EYF80_025168 [Liparis tanakae]